MCFGGGGGSGAAAREAKRAREAEEARQAEIRQGRQNINAIFDGGLVDDRPVRVPSSSARSPTPTRNRPTSPRDWGTPESRSSVVARQTPTRNRPTSPRDWGPPETRSSVFARQTPARGTQPQSTQPQSTQPQSTQPQSTQPQGRQVEGFGFATDEFFANNRQAFMDYALPQLDQQFGEASKELTFDLARSGLRNSSVRGEQGGKLQRLYDQNMQQITDEALSREQQQRNAVEDARANLLSMLQTTGDAQGATNQALSRAAVLSQPQPFSPMGQLFTDFTAGLGTQAAMERAESMSGGRFQSRYNTGLFGASNNAVTNRR